MRDRVYLASPHMSGEEQKYIQEAFDTNWIAPLGPHVDAFEREIADYAGTADAAALSSGTAALHLALKLAGVKQNDTVFCSSLTFSASCNPIRYEYAVPVFIDSTPDNWNMSYTALEKAFDEHRPKAVIVADLYGQSADMLPIAELCHKHGAVVIEDSAEALGATYMEKKCGAWGDFGVYSFNGNKIITTSGGGMLLSDDVEALKKARFFATQAREKARHYQHEEIGYNYRISNVLAGIGRAQLHVLSDRLEKKKAIYDRYKEAFSDIHYISMMPEADYGECNHWLSCFTLDAASPVTPLDIMLALERENVESRPIWKPMNLQPVFKMYPFYSHNGCGVSAGEDIFNRGVCLPSDTKMSAELQDEIIAMIKKLF